jgi:hypothetical protein|tara:strand:+ start:1002 stop:1103 length:102 start_codon:yes stop_codon:yes gene_type:complete
MNKIKILAQKLWVDYRGYVIGTAIGIVIGVVLF